MISTKYGYKDISDLHEGDILLNNTFSFDILMKKELFSYDSNYILKLDSGSTISLSSNKSVFVSKRISSFKNDSYGIRYPYSYFTKPFWITVSDLTSEYLLYGKCSKNMKLPEYVSKRLSSLMKQPSFLFLLGMYLGSGYIETTNDHSVLFLTFPKSYLDMVLHQVDDLCFTYVVDTFKTITKIKIFDKDFIFIINQMFLGNILESKSIPFVLYELPLMQLHYLFQGFQLTSGKLQNNKIILRHSNKSLILGLSQLLLKFRYIYEFKDLTDLHGNPLYELSYSSNDSKNTAIYFKGLNVYYSIKEIQKVDTPIKTTKLQLVDPRNGYLFDNIIVKDK